MPDDVSPVRWTGNQAVVTFPEHVDASNAGAIRELLLRLVNQGAAAVIADMSATVSCDHGGADALARAHQRASVNGTRLRVVATAPVVRRVLAASGLDRLVSMYPSLDAALAAGTPGNVVPLAAWTREDRRTKARRRVGRPISPAVLLALVDALADGIVLTDDDGVVVLANRRAEEMFGYQHGELAGRPVESLIPADLRAAHARERAQYQRQPVARPMGSRARLVGLRKDGSTFPVRVSLDPVPTATGRFVVAVVRDATGGGPYADLADLARAAAAEESGRHRELLDRVVNGLYHVGLTLTGAGDLPHDVAVRRIGKALRLLDEVIREIRAEVFPRDHDRH